MAITWTPPEARPADGEDIEAQIADAVPSAEVRLTRAQDGWRVRALLPAAMCARGASFSDRDVSGRVREILEDAGLSVADPRQ